MAVILEKLAGQFLSQRPPMYRVRCGHCGREYRASAWAHQLRARERCSHCRPTPVRHREVRATALLEAAAMARRALAVIHGARGERA
jgi:hypothetical protein